MSQNDKTIIVRKVSSIDSQHRLDRQRPAAAAADQRLLILEIIDPVRSFVTFSNPCWRLDFFVFPSPRLSIYLRHPRQFHRLPNSTNESRAFWNEQVCVRMFVQEAEIGETTGYQSKPQNNRNLTAGGKEDVVIGGGFWFGGNWLRDDGGAAHVPVGGAAPVDCHSCKTFDHHFIHSSLLTAFSPEGFCGGPSLGLNLLAASTSAVAAPLVDGNATASDLGSEVAAPLVDGTVAAAVDASLGSCGRRISFLAKLSSSVSELENLIIFVSEDVKCFSSLFFLQFKFF